MLKLMNIQYPKQYLFLFFSHYGKADARDHLMLLYSIDLMKLWMWEWRLEMVFHYSLDLKNG